MRLIKPYGRSQTDSNQRRRLSLKPEFNTLINVSDLPKRSDDFLLSMWISAIDKIFTKPLAGKKPTDAQRAARQKLGEAAWPLFSEKISSPSNMFQKKWDKKIHPYGEETRSNTNRDKPSYKKTKSEKEPTTEGLWYTSFAPNTPASELTDQDYQNIAKKIEQHLFKAALSAQNKAPEKPQGRIDVVLQSVERNVLAEKAEREQFSTDIISQYLQRCKSDPAKQIHIKIQKSSHIRGREAWQIAVECLKEAYANIFSKETSIAQAKQEHPELLTLHESIKATYRRLLKDSRVKLELKKVRIPKDWNSLIALVQAKASNQNINQMIRMGRIIHYEAGQDDVLNWIAKHHSDSNLRASRFWLSDGQAEIKRNEVLVRLWRHVIGLAGQTLTDWAGAQNSEDIFMSREISKTIENFCLSQFDLKLSILFGEYARTVRELPQCEKEEVLKFALENWAQIRHNSFHFKNITQFEQALKPSGNHEVAQNLWTADNANHAEQMKRNLEAVHISSFFTQEEAQQIFNLCSADAPRAIPLPRFRRVLSRAEHTEPTGVRLPKPHNQTEYQDNKWLHCQHNVLMLLYQRAFPAWLDNRDADTINCWITVAATRATEAAKNINKDETAIAKQATIVRLNSGESFGIFADRLTAASATEMRVQRGYESNPEEARKQAKYVGDLECDVVSRAFCEWLNEQGLSWLTAKAEPKPAQVCQIDQLREPTKNGDCAKDWLKGLYFLIHMVPVEQINMLHHQLVKLSCLEKKAQSSEHYELTNRLQTVLTLYIDMHDARFTGKERPESDDFAELKPLFQSEHLFENVFPKNIMSDQNNAQMPPFRGLREMKRFGMQQPLWPVFTRYPIQQTDLTTFQKHEQTIAATQNERQTLHESWAKAKKKKKFIDENREKYRNLINQITDHREARHHLHLTNHVRLHRLLMQVLGRLADYSGLWERDLYFIMLAVLYQQKNADIRNLFSGNGTEKLENGQIVYAFRKLETHIKTAVKEVFPVDKHITDTRNNFAHFTMLRPKKEQSEVELNLTDEVNKARQLMAYDRKLKNAVSKSVIELLHREGLLLSWHMKEHELADCVIRPRTINHLDKKSITENLHSRKYVKMVADIFGGKAEKPQKQHRNKGQKPHPKRKKR